MWAVDNVVGVEATGPGHRPMILGLFPTHHLLLEAHELIIYVKENSESDDADHNATEKNTQSMTEILARDIYHS